mmetsp:Transcript_26013/g.39825  ORF Transcript_26013/g.39825 Transcript_26013/m.39825 type:complete len:182 (+) Transcript_26013:1626-2171(+)
MKSQRRRSSFLGIENQPTLSRKGVPSSEEGKKQLQLPLYSRIGGLNRDKLRLINYSLSEKASSNLIGIINTIQRTTIRHIHLEKCGINNPSIFNHLLESISKMEDFSSIIIRSEQLSFSPEQMMPLLSKHAPKSLTELKIEFCKLAKKSILDLTECLKNLHLQTCGCGSLMSVSLIDANLS